MPPRCFRTHSHEQTHTWRRTWRSVRTMCFFQKRWTSNISVLRKTRKGRFSKESKVFSERPWLTKTKLREKRVSFDLNLLSQVVIFLAKAVQRALSSSCCVGSPSEPWQLSTSTMRCCHAHDALGARAAERDERRQQ